MKTNGNDPIEWMHAVLMSHGPSGLTAQCPGLTKREYFAAMAMQGLALRDHNQGRPLYKQTSIEYEAVSLADALISELNKDSK